nr:hypothetical protein [uncultured Rhodoferax sp.]
MQKKWMLVVWPAFLAACVMETVVFALFDPHDLQGWARGLGHQGIYTLAFFAFWAITAASSSLTYTLGLSAAELNRDDSLPAGCPRGHGPH